MKTQMAIKRALHKTAYDTEKHQPSQYYGTLTNQLHITHEGVCGTRKTTEQMSENKKTNIEHRKYHCTKPYSHQNPEPERNTGV